MLNKTHLNVEVTYISVILTLKYDDGASHKTYNYVFKHIKASAKASACTRAWCSHIGKYIQSYACI